MRWTTSAVLPLLLIACGERPAEPLADMGPSLNASAEHQALVVRGDQTASLFDGDGELVTATCRATEVYTVAATGRINIVVRCELPNLSGVAAVYTPDDNPRAPGLCGRWVAPDGSVLPICDWREIVSASGKVLFTAWVGP